MPDPLPHLRAKSSTRRQPHGESLTHHSTATLTASGVVAARVGTLPGLPDPLDAWFWSLAAWAALGHDAGKAATGFQDMLAGRPAGWSAGQRHEVVSLGFLAHLLDGDALTFVAAAVACHHRALTGDSGHKPSLANWYSGLTAEQLAAVLGPVPDRDATDLTAWLAATATSHTLTPAARPVGPITGTQILQAAHDLLTTLFDVAELTTPARGRAIVLLQGAVTFADHLSSAGTALHTVQPFDARWPKALDTRLAAAGGHLHPHQRRAADIHGHLLLRAPTGAGKTEAALLWAVEQIAALALASGGVPRLYYTLPYLASINAMVSRLTTELDRLGEAGAQLVGVAHSRAASHYLHASLTTDDTDTGTAASPTAQEAAKALARHHATRLFRETVRVATPYQLLRGALAGPAHSSTLLDTANSVFILDELHAYDPKRLGFLLASARFWAELGGRVCVLSATIPDRAAALLHTTLPGLHDLTPDQPTPPRHLLHTHPDPLDSPAAHEAIAARLRAGQSVLVVANNIADAQHLYQVLAPLAQDLYGDEAAWLLHSRYRRDDRSRIEEALHHRWATGTPSAPGLLIGTQAIEVSLDISLDAAHIAAATLEAMLQRFGRVNRDGARPPADVIVHAPTYRTRRTDPSGQLYADGIYPQPPVDAAWHLLAAHHGQPLDEPTTSAWLNHIYAGDWGDRWAEEVTDHRDTFTRAFLTFRSPLRDRSDLADQFDQLFDGTEAILAADRDTYAQRLATGRTAEGRLLADDLLIPLPFYAHAPYDQNLGVRVIDGDYTPEHGLTALHGRQAATYRLGEIL